jgi:AcrR family transcriptional regulator
MTPAAKTARKLSTAEERRESVLAAAMPVFAERGYHAAPTMDIAKAAGISQAYLFRLFPTKPELFAAVTGVARERLLAAFSAAAAKARAEGLDPLETMGRAHYELLRSDRDTLLVQLHSQVVAAHEPLIRDVMRQCFNDIYELVARESGANPEALRTWFAHGMLCNVMAAIDADHLDAPWARVLSSWEDDAAS